MKELKLQNSPLFALVDDEDYERCLALPWYISSGNTIKTTIALSPIATDNIPLANFILNTKEKIDHKDRNFLNNSKLNFRFCTHAQNMSNRAKFKGKYSSKYKGVSWYYKLSKWICRIRHNGKLIHLGYFIDEIEAAKTYDVKARELHGEFAVLNFSSSTK